MKKNKIFGLLPLIYAFHAADCPTVGGQAVMEGVMMRNGDFYGLAVRRAKGDIYAQRLPWFSLTGNSALKLPLLRGFPILLETMINGIQALNRSARLCSEDQGSSAGTSSWQLAGSLCLAFLMAIGLFVVVPHLLSFLMFHFNFGGDVEGLTFHIWDGFFKCAIFMAYIWLISFVPDIRRVFEYHGAEHKTIHAWEQSDFVEAATACRMSRLHPRCGTTFLLFVICISIIAQALLVPFFLKFSGPQGMLVKHVESVFFKLLLVIPISAVAYELIRFAARLQGGFWATILQWPGLALQIMTTQEPDRGQLEVAVVALAEALGPDGAEKVRPVAYARLPLE